MPCIPRHCQFDRQLGVMMTVFIQHLHPSFCNESVERQWIREAGGKTEKPAYIHSTYRPLPRFCQQVSDPSLQHTFVSCVRSCWCFVLIMQYSVSSSHLQCAAMGQALSGPGSGGTPSLDSVLQGSSDGNGVKKKTFSSFSFGWIGAMVK
mgnify:CR=1 FL=1